MIQFGMNINETPTHEDARKVVLDEFLDGKTFVRVGLTTFENLSDEFDANAVHIRIVGTMDVVEANSEYHHRLRDDAYELACDFLSETTNNDACDVLVRERSAHFDAHPDLVNYHNAPFGSYIIIDAIVQDYLT